MALVSGSLPFPQTAGLEYSRGGTAYPAVLTGDGDHHRGQITEISARGPLRPRHPDVPAGIRVGGPGTAVGRVPADGGVRPPRTSDHREQLPGVGHSLERMAAPVGERDAGTEHEGP